MAALVLGTLASAVCFAARPGLNWALWTIPAAAGLYVFTRRVRPQSAVAIAPLVLSAVILAIGAAVTANMMLHSLIFLAVVTLLAWAARIAWGAPVESVGAGFIVASPPIGALSAVAESFRRTGELARDGGARRSLPVARGILIATPVVIVLWLLLGSADPNLSTWGRAILDALTRLEFVPRLFFGIATTGLVLGTYGLVLRGKARSALLRARPRLELSAVERLIVLSAVAALFALFVALQLTYLFGDPAGTAGTGTTYAEWARRGFGELTTAAMLVTLLIATLDAIAIRGDARAERATRAISLVLVALTMLIVLSAFRRIVLYESAYGYTSARLWAQAIMAGIAVALILLALEILRGLDPRRLARRIVLAAALFLVGLTYWDHEAFIVHRNVTHFAASDRLDIDYLTRLSLDALPALMAVRPAIPAAKGAEYDHALKCGLVAEAMKMRPRLRWFEFAWRRRAAIGAAERFAVEFNDSQPCAGRSD